MPDQGKTGFLEESPGVRSMSRLTIGWLLGLASAVVFALVFYVVFALTHKLDVSAAVISALAVPLGALVWHGVVALKNRNGPDAHE
jgi:hypothetical protein